MRQARAHPRTQQARALQERVLRRNDLEKGGHKDNHNGHAHGDASSGVQKGHSLGKRKDGQRRDLELEEGGASEDDDPDE